MSRKQKLELTWIGKDLRPRLEPRILTEDQSLSHHADRRFGSEILDNKLVEGDNLLASRALETEFAGRVQCCYIDPPYNTGSAFEHYDDGLEHSLWLSLIRDRIEIIHQLLSRTGSLWVSIDDNECHYLKVVIDEIFGRTNFVANVIWQKKYAPANDALWISDSHDHILVYAKEKSNWSPNKLARAEKSDSAYKNPDNDSRGKWKSGDYTCNKSADERPNLYYGITNPNTGQEVWPKKRLCGATTKTHTKGTERRTASGGAKTIKTKFLHSSGSTMMSIRLLFHKPFGRGKKLDIIKTQSESNKR